MSSAAVDMSHEIGRVGECCIKAGLAAHRGRRGWMDESCIMTDWLDE